LIEYALCIYCACLEPVYKMILYSALALYSDDEETVMHMQTHPLNEMILFCELPVCLDTFYTLLLFKREPLVDFLRLLKIHLKLTN
jgi:hypothetical protein